MNGRRLGAVVSLAYLGAMWWVCRPVHQDPAPALWHYTARAAGTVARWFGTLALVAEWRYWRLVGA